MIARRQRHQTGSVWLKSSSWYLRAYTNVGGERKQVARFLAYKDDKHHSKTCKAVQDLAAEMIAKENSVASIKAEKAHTLKQFWDGTYQPYIEESKRLSTRKSYEDLWERIVEPVLSPTPITSIRTRDVSLLLTALAKKQHGRSSIAHVRSLISGIMTHAENLGVLEHNPVHDCKVLAAVKQPTPTKFYTQEEVEAIVKDLDGMPDICRRRWFGRSMTYRMLRAEKSIRSAQSGTPVFGSPRRATRPSRQPSLCPEAWRPCSQARLRKLSSCRF